LGGPEWTAAPENLVEAADGMEQPPPSREVGPHPDDPEAVLLAEPLGLCQLEFGRHGSDPAVLRLLDHLTVKQVTRGLFREGLVDAPQPVGRNNAVIIGEGDDRRGGPVDTGVVRPREAGLLEVNVSEARVLLRYREQDVACLVRGALVYDRQIELVEL